MERLRPISLVRFAGVVSIVWIGAALSGCVHPREMSRSVSNTVQKLSPWSPPAPATQFMCFWHRQLSTLPNPGNDLTMTPGLAGQVFLITNENQPAEVMGDITIAVYDDTPRPDGVPAKTPEVWHFTKDTLKNLVTADERFGKCYALFLPWPAEWKDVNRVRILSRYDPVGGPTIHSGESKVVLDSSNDGPIWSQSKDNSPFAAGNQLRVPSGAKLIEQASGFAPPATTTPIVPAGGLLIPTLP